MRSGCGVRWNARPARAPDVLALLLPVLDHLFGNVFSAWLKYKTDRNANVLAGFQSAAGFDRDVALATLQAEVQLAATRAAANGWWGSRLVIVAGGLLSVTYFGAIVLDSLFRFGWSVAKLPTPWDTYCWAILQSFFVLGLTQHLTGSLTGLWLNRKS
jgi:hypothetical protein